MRPCSETSNHDPNISGNQMVKDDLASIGVSLLLWSYYKLEPPVSQGPLPLRASHLRPTVQTAGIWPEEVLFLT